MHLLVLVRDFVAPCVPARSGFSCKKLDPWQVSHELDDPVPDLVRLLAVSFNRRDDDAVDGGARPFRLAMKAVLRSVIWFVSMFIFMLLSRTLANLFKKLNNVPIIGPINSTLGAVLGLAEGIVVIYLIAQAVNGICLLTSDSLMFLNSQTVGKTYLFRYFSEFDIISLFG